tara:strand:+ start:27 stop:425 length:399 start_codon:yes stop_codon:yes gene_type:complete
MPYVSAAQRKAVWASKKDGGKGHPKNKKKSPKKFNRGTISVPKGFEGPSRMSGGGGGEPVRVSGGYATILNSLGMLGGARPFKMKSPMKKKGKKDACYHKVKRSAKVWPSAYASGRLVQCRKVGAANYGKKK